MRQFKFEPAFYEWHLMDADTGDVLHVVDDPAEYMGDYATEKEIEDASVDALNAADEFLDADKQLSNDEINAAAKIMAKALYNYYKSDDFNAFVSAVKSLINDIKSYHLDGGKYRLEDFDLRTMYGDVFRIPMENSDFIEMWGAVQDAYKKYLNGGVSEFFIDVYWNNTLEHAAYYDNEVLWIEFKDETIIYY